MQRNRSALNRRQFFTRSAMAAGAGALGGGFFDALVARSASAGERRGHGDSAGYGPLRVAGDDLALPAGFHTRVVANEGDPMDDGFPTPKAMDGMATFPCPMATCCSCVTMKTDKQAIRCVRDRREARRRLRDSERSTRDTLWPTSLRI